MNYEQTIKTVIEAANKSEKPDFNTAMAIRDDHILKGRIWAYSPDQNKYSVDATMKGMVDDDLRGRTEFRIKNVRYVLKTYAEMMALQNTEAKGTQQRYLPGSDTPLAEGDHGFELTDAQMVQLHFIMSRQPTLDQWQVIEDILGNKMRRYEDALDDLTDIERVDKVAYARWQTSFYQPSRPHQSSIGSAQFGGNADRQLLREDLMQCFSLDEIESLCFDIGIDHENIAGSSKSGKVLELVQYTERHGLLNALRNAAKKRNGRVR